MVTRQPEGAGRPSDRDPAASVAASAAAETGAPDAGPPESAADSADVADIAEAAKGTVPEAALAEMADRWRRALADLDNFRKSVARDRERDRAATRAEVAAAWLPVVDNLDLALRHSDASPDAVVDGVRAVRDQAVDVLSRLGFPREEETGVPFDPARHEVVSVVDEPGIEPGTVVRVVRPGYGAGRHQLRPMAVAVSRTRT